jgi:hypothetical protein
VHYQLWKGGITMNLLDTALSKILYLLIIGLFLFEFSAGLAISHLDTVHECQASNCVNERIALDH